MVPSCTASARVSLFLSNAIEFTVRVVPADRFGDRTADQAEPDKSDFCMFHSMS